MSITTDELIEALGREGAMHLAGQILAGYGDNAATDALLDRAERIEITNVESDLVYVPDTWRLPWTYHAINAGDHWTLVCNGTPTRWQATTACLPTTVARRVGQPCSVCFGEPTQID